MNGKQYMDTSVMLIRIGKEIERLDLDGFLQCIENAETTLPQLNDVMRKRAEANLNAVKRLATEYVKLKRTVIETRETIMNTSMAYNVKTPEVKS